jgi:hypothetical protein
MAICFSQVVFTIINSGKLDADSFLPDVKQFSNLFLLHFQNAPLSGDRPILVTLKPISNYKIQVSTGPSLSDSDRRLETNAAELYV